MTTNAVPTHADTFDRPGFSITGFIKPIVEYTSAWINTCVDYWSAADMYEQLSRLSDAELHHRGLTRANLGQEICKSFENARDCSMLGFSPR